MKEKLHIITQNFNINKHNKQQLKGHLSCVIWFTGLSGSGKSTLANEVEQALYKSGINTFILDGDNLRNGLNNDLTFTHADRAENIRRAAEVAKILINAGVVVLCTFISPFEKDRELAKLIIGKENFIEVFVDCPIEECEQRDVKGLYKKARLGEITNFTGISSPFETPTNPNITVNTAINSITHCCNKILDYCLPKILLHE